MMPQTFYTRMRKTVKYPSQPRVAGKDLAEDEALETSFKKKEPTMERDPTTPLQPSVEEQVHRVIKAGEQAQRNASNELDRTADQTGQMADQAADRAGQAANRAGQAANRVADRAGQAADQAGDQAQSVIQQATDKAKDMVQDLRSSDIGTTASNLTSQAADKASEIGAQAADKADAAMTTTGESLENLAQTVRANAPSGKVGDIATTAADALERSGNYLQQADPAVVRSDLEEIIRRRPVESLLVGLGIGFLLARALRR